jgi:16S rRNA (adenine1518-N6/adenine1519-N6)-dimethyltransferase
MIGDQRALGDPAELATPAGTARVLRTFGIRPLKRFGQHFLISRRILDRIIEEVSPAPGDQILEVGAGLGTLTAALAARGAAVLAVELDSRLVPVLRAMTGKFPTVRLVHADIMTIDLKTLAPGITSVAANLPYGIASVLLIRLLEELPALRRLVVTVQSEVADRISAAPGGKIYGALTVAVQYRSEARVVTRVPRGAFYPPPEVESAVLRLDVRSSPAVSVRDEALFFRVVRAAFSQRRKVLRNALATLAPEMTPQEAEQAAQKAGIDPRRRGETLTLREFGALADSVALVLQERASPRAAPSWERG